MNVLAIDIGGSNIKLRTERRSEIVKFESGPKMTPSRMIAEISEIAHDWAYDRVSLGFPGPVLNNRPLREPHNLGDGWRTFEFDHAFDEKPVQMINDAAMQALGSYRGGSMLFLGLGTGLGAAIVCDGVVHGTELAHLPWKKGHTFERYVGLQGYQRTGKKRWTKHVFQMIDVLKAAMAVDYVILGGGNAKLLKQLPNQVFLGDNHNAFQGGFMLWREPLKAIPVTPAPIGKQS